MTDVRKFGKSAATAVFERVGRGVSRVQERKPLPSDLLESDDAYLVVFDAPGATSSDVQVRFVDGEVQVRVDRFRDHHEGFEMRFPGRGLSLDGHVTLPPDADVDAEDATATLTEHGTLEVEVPKEPRGRDVEVREASDEATD
ncbi:MAG: Hsp20/alpha crystallin family protein [Haloferacaceae archaeon]